jgi:hypothetical protein
LSLTFKEMSLEFVPASIGKVTTTAVDWRVARKVCFGRFQVALQASLIRERRTVGIITSVSSLGVLLRFVISVQDISLDLQDLDASDTQSAPKTRTLCCIPETGRT